MKTVLCYGDSLTWGYDAETTGRHRRQDRWPMVLQALLGDGVEVIAEGLNGRTTTFDDALVAADRNGARVLPTLLTSHAPIDLVVIMLGTNDMKPYIHGSPFVAQRGMKRLVEIVRTHDYPAGEGIPDVLLVAPPLVAATKDAEFAEIFKGAVETSSRLAALYEVLADELGCGFFDAGKVAKTTPIDGVHLDAENTKKIGEALAPLVRVMLQL